MPIWTQVSRWRLTCSGRCGVFVDLGEYEFLQRIQLHGAERYGRVAQPDVGPWQGWSRQLWHLRVFFVAIVSAGIEHRLSPHLAWWNGEFDAAIGGFPVAQGPQWIRMYPDERPMNSIYLHL